MAAVDSAISDHLQAEWTTEEVTAGFALSGHSLGTGHATSAAIVGVSERLAYELERAPVRVVLGKERRHLELRRTASSGEMRYRSPFWFCSMTVEEITLEIRLFRDERDWEQFHNPKDMAEAICIEAAELLEHFLWKRPNESAEVALALKDEVSDEMADIAIYLFEMAANLNVDLLQAMQSKLAKNAVKYPVAKAKGKNLKYTEL
jgi:dCTP diphosphatase